MTRRTLIEIAAAALERKAAEIFLQECRLAWRGGREDDYRLCSARGRRDAAQFRFDAALSKVTFTPSKEE